MSINDLPDEILELVFYNVDLRSRFNCQLTCQRWRKLMVHALQPPICVWIDEDDDNGNYFEYPKTPLDQGELHNHSWDIYVVHPRKAEWFLRRHNRGKALHLRLHSRSMLQTCLDALERDWSILKNLQIHVFSLKPARTWVQLIAHHNVVKRITSVSFSGRHIKEERAYLLEQLCTNCTSLSSLHIDGLLGVNIRSLKLASRLLALFVRDLDLSEVDFEVDDLKHLKEFAFLTCSAVDLLKICKTMKELVTLRFTLKAGERPESFRHLAELSKLRNLTVSSTKVNADTHILAVLSKLSNLRTLALGGQCVTRSLLQALPTTVPQIEVLKLWKDFTQAGYAEAMRTLPQLGELNHLKRLEVPSFERCITPFVIFIENSPSVRYIDASGASNEFRRKLLFDAVSKKAHANPSQRFHLRLGSKPENLDMFPANVSLYYVSKSYSVYRPGWLT